MNNPYHVHSGSLIGVTLFGYHHQKNRVYFPEPQPSLVHNKQMVSINMSTTFEVSILQHIPFTLIAGICGLYVPHSSALSIFAAIFLTDQKHRVRGNKKSPISADLDLIYGIKVFIPQYLYTSTKKIYTK